MKYLICLFSVLNLSLCLGQISLGTKDSIYSAILKENREIWIYLPEDAKTNPDHKYPVIYLLDGETYFHAFTGEVSHLSEVNGNAIIPDMIVVGIINTNRGRDLSPSHDSTSNIQSNGGGEKFTLFIEKELIPFIESHYPTAPYRMLVGHSLGGLFVVNILLKHSHIFNSYISLDPAFDWHKKKLLLESETLLSGLEFENKSFFLGGSSLCLESNSEFEGLLKTKNVEGLRWRSKYYPDDSHGSVPLIGSYDGLRFIFDFYKRPSFTTITDSSIIILSKHYENLTLKMGYAIYPPENLLLGLAWRCRVLEKNYDRAYQFLLMAESIYPNSIEVCNALAELYKDKGEEEKVKQYLDKASRLVKKETEK